MSKRLIEMKAQHDEVVARIEAIQEIAGKESRDYSDEENTEIEAGLKTADDLKTKITRETAISNLAKTKLGGQLESGGIVSGESFKVPARAMRGNLRSFVGANAERDAYVSGHFLAASLFGSKSSQEWCSSHGVDVRAAMSTTDNSKGGYLVPDPLEAAIIRQVEEYGVFRQAVGRVWPMPNGSTKVAKRNGGYTAYYVGENVAITASDMSLAQVSLSAKKLGVLTQVSSELMEDSLIQLADVMATEFAYAFANAEDEAGFNGDGTGTYGGITGLKNSLAAGAIVTAVSSANTFAELTIATLHEAYGKLARYPGIMPKWYMHSTCWANAFQRLAFAAGGNTAENYQNGMGPQFMGFPVVFTQVMTSGTSTTDNASATIAYLGDLSMTASMGDSRGITVASDSSKYFAEDALAVKATERFDIVCHDVGTASIAGACVQVKLNTA